MIQLSMCMRVRRRTECVVKWHENDDTSNEEIDFNYPDVWLLIAKYRRSVLEFQPEDFVQHHLSLMLLFCNDVLVTNEWVWGHALNVFTINFKMNIN